MTVILGKTVRKILIEVGAIEGMIFCQSDPQN
jgi:hypothetical protein